ncbi:hypothetical protein ACP70R_012276 [Stipagrostis hirtigluma subsp. patula]
MLVHLPEAMNSPPPPATVWSAQGAGVGVLGVPQRQVQLAVVVATEPFPSLPPPVPGSCDDDDHRWRSPLLSAFEQLPVKSKLLVTVHMALYGPRSRRRLPAFQAICPSDH